MNDWDPLVRELFLTLQEFPASWEEKQAAMAAAAELCRTCFELAAVLDEHGEMAMIPGGMMRVGNFAEAEEKWES
jgi:hypothetical protein